MKKIYKIRVKIGSANEDVIKECLRWYNLENETRILREFQGFAIYSFETDKETWKSIKNELDLRVESKTIYCSFL